MAARETRAADAQPMEAVSETITIKSFKKISGYD
jgi:hypothetical protein